MSRTKLLLQARDRSPRFSGAGQPRRVWTNAQIHHQQPRPGFVTPAGHGLRGNPWPAARVRDVGEQTTGHITTPSTEAQSAVGTNWLPCRRGVESGVDEVRLQSTDPECPVGFDLQFRRLLLDRPGNTFAAARRCIGTSAAPRRGMSWCIHNLRERINNKYISIRILCIQPTKEYCPLAQQGRNFLPSLDSR
jgi:hypothetical protein